MSTPDPKKAVHLKPGRRSLKRRSQPKQEPQWEEHRGSHALDPWGTAIRAMRQAGTWTGEQK